MSCLGAMLMGIASCNSKSESGSVTYQPSSLAAVTQFKLKANSKVAEKLDSVFFSIDLNHGVIFNADSLPVGTSVSKLVADITYSTSASAVTLTQSGGAKEGEIDYKSSPTDTIDFSGKVVLSITAEDGTTKKEYRIKVNVHKCEPDSLTWDQLAVTPMPSRLGSPKAQKTVAYKGTTYTMIEESDGSYTMAVATDLIAGDWSKETPALDFEPDVRSMAATETSLCILDRAGLLHTSADGLTWSNTGLEWTSIIGAYGDTMLGLRQSGGKLVHTCWPAEAGYAETEVKAGFPVAGRSNMVQFSNRWTTLPISFLTGGLTADGSVSGATWGFDGDHWEILSQGMTPRVEGATIVPYYVYRKTTSSLVQTEFSVWMLIGGRFEDGTPNLTIYTSYDNGVNWYAADNQMQLPEHFPGLWNLDGIMAEWPKSANLSDAWASEPARSLVPWARVKYNIEDYEIYWDCPYIYIFGGINEDGALNDQIWRGVLNRLTFTPQF